MNGRVSHWTSGVVSFVASVPHRVSVWLWAWRKGHPRGRHAPSVPWHRYMGSPPVCVQCGQAWGDHAGNRTCAGRRGA